jgi:hypothetical protein
MHMKRTVQALLVLAAVAGSAPAWAALGEPAASLANDEAALEAARKPAQSLGAYRVERLETTTHAVREYVTPSGTVFAVAWEGVSHPDLTVLLGSYADPYRQEVARLGASPGRRGRRIEKGGAVVETWGHQRALHGRAWVPALLPPGVTPDDVR